MVREDILPGIILSVLGLGVSFITLFVLHDGAGFILLFFCAFAIFEGIVDVVQDWRKDRKRRRWNRMAEQFAVLHPNPDKDTVRVWEQCPVCGEKLDRKPFLKAGYSLKCKNCQTVWDSYGYGEWRETW